MIEQQYFDELAGAATKKLSKDEVFTAWLSAEQSDFCRLNGGLVRQAGTVSQAAMSFRLIQGSRSAPGQIGLSGVRSVDEARLSDLVQILRDQLGQLPDDPHLMYATEVRSSTAIHPSQLPDSGTVIQTVAAKSKGTDMVGLYAAGSLVRGFANSLGQRNWYETHSFGLDWSFYLRADKAVKTEYAGFAWSELDFERKMDEARRQLGVLERPSRVLKPGRYRVYLAPMAVQSVVEMLSWGGFSLKAHRTKQTPLLKMVEGGARFHPSVTMRENTKDGVGPDFNASGYVKPAAVTLVDGGAYRDCLVSPRSAKEYGVATNGAGSDESPSTFELGAGTLATSGVTAQLRDGIYLNNLWYLNFSDRPACRVTGMTRFAAFWVEGGQIQAPIEVMRFDESLFRALGEKLEGLTQERDFFLNSSTYGERQTGSTTLPGALVDDFAFTL